MYSRPKSDVDSAAWLCESQQKLGVDVLGSGRSMAHKRRIYISLPADTWMSKKQIALKWAIVDEIEKLGYEAQVFGGPVGGRGLPAGMGWSPRDCIAVMRRCIGAAIIGLPKWVFSIDRRSFRLATEYCHHEGALAHAYGLPILTIVEKGVEPRLMLNPLCGQEIIPVPPAANPSWLSTDSFRRPFQTWNAKLEWRRDVFLGYCGSSLGTARNLKRFLETLNVTILDWHEDFAPGKSILQQIEEAASRCSVGIFLFTNDDKVMDESQSGSAVPRDNVVFEAGFFSHAKGKDRVLIIREEGSKMPADLGGDIYAPLADKADISSVEPYVKRFIAEHL